MENEYTTLLELHKNPDISDRAKELVEIVYMEKVMHEISTFHAVLDYIKYFADEDDRDFLRTFL